jgi:hypothetical protein
MNNEQHGTALRFNLSRANRMQPRACCNLNQRT